MPGGIDLDAIRAAATHVTDALTRLATIDISPDDHELTDLRDSVRYLLVL